MQNTFPHQSLSALQAEALTLLAEEASEVAIECSKILRSGPDFCRRGRDVSNKQHLAIEIVDFFVLLGVCNHLGLIQDDMLVDGSLIAAKVEKLKQWSNLGDVAAEAVK